MNKDRLNGVLDKYFEEKDVDKRQKYLKQLKDILVEHAMSVSKEERIEMWRKQDQEELDFLLSRGK